MEVKWDLGIVGGGPAGCAAAITAARAGKRVLLCEKGRYPRHRVCGEFVSPESHHLLGELLGANHRLLTAAPRISGARMFSDGNCIDFRLPQPGWSISRFHLDHALWEAALAVGVHARQATTVGEIGRTFIRIGDNTIPVGATVNASGRWSNLRKSTAANGGPHWIGVKAHFAGEVAPPSTDIYFFEGGYCGVQPVSEAQVNASAMVRADVATSLEEVFAAHPQLWARSRAWEQVTDTVSTSPLIHGSPEPISDGVINAGDAAAFIDPFTGDGISLALRSGVLAAMSLGVEEYASEYQIRFGRAFRTAAFTRRLSRSPKYVRQLAAYAFRSNVVKDWALRNTRGR